VVTDRAPLGVEGRGLRLARLFGPDNRCLVLPIDHGVILGRLPGFEAIDDSMQRFLSWPVDGFLMTSGLAARYARAIGQRPRSGLMLTGDSFYLPWGQPGPTLEPVARGTICSPFRAVALGADVLKIVFFADTESAARMAEVGYVARTVEESHGCGLPVVVEPLVATSCSSQERKRYVADACRVCAELGVDLLKVEYPGQPDEMRQLVDDVGLPMVILGGSLAGDEEDVVKLVEGALEGGASGIVIGRNIWQREPRQAEELIEHLRRLVHP
jgi:class I fructose-bisphosphate aldolase